MQKNTRRTKQLDTHDARSTENSDEGVQKTQVTMVSIAVSNKGNIIGLDNQGYLHKWDEDARTWSKI